MALEHVSMWGARLYCKPYSLIRAVARELTVNWMDSLSGRKKNEYTRHNLH